MRELDEIKDDLVELSLMSCKPDFKKPKNNDVIDENKSVIWNREEIQKLQKEYDDEVKRLNTQKNKKRDSLYEEVYEYIVKNISGITIDGAKKIFDYAYQEGHATGFHDVFCILEELINLFDDVLNY